MEDYGRSPDLPLTFQVQNGVGAWTYIQRFLCAPSRRLPSLRRWINSSPGPGIELHRRYVVMGLGWNNLPSR